MTYKINGTTLTLQPTSAKWIPRTELGISGSGHPVYSGVREYELTWNLASPSEVNQLMTFFNSMSMTGTAIVDLPQYGASTYTFFSYTGCVLREPSFDAYFSENQTSVSMIISNIRT